MVRWNAGDLREMIESGGYGTLKVCSFEGSPVGFGDWTLVRYPRGEETLGEQPEQRAFRSSWTANQDAVGNVSRMFHSLHGAPFAYMSRTDIHDGQVG